MSLWRQRPNGPFTRRHPTKNSNKNLFSWWKRAQLVDSYKKQDRDLMAQYDKKTGLTWVKARPMSSRQQWLKDSDLAHDSTTRYCKDRCWADDILLIRELNRRHPKGAKQTELLRLYQHPTNVLGLAAIADHLELHSKLPDVWIGSRNDLQLSGYLKSLFWCGINNTWSWG